jgi:hypothetical protein
MYDTARWVGMTAGPLVAAALFAVGGVALPLALNGVSFVVAAAVMASVAIAPAQPDNDEERPGHGIRAGLAAALTMPAIAIVVASSGGVFLAGGLLNVCEPLLARHVLHGSPSDYALLVACYCAGMVSASALIAQRGAKPAHVLIPRYAVGVLLLAAGICGSAIAGSVLLAGITFAATGTGNGLLVVSGTQLILTTVPNAVQGRLFGAKDVVEGACFVLGLAGAGALVAGAGVRVTLGTAGAICGVCGLAAIVALRGRAAGLPAIATATAGVEASAGTPEGLGPEP